MKYGFIQSKLDGTEKQFKEAQGLPSEYSYMKQLPKVLDQGNRPICVPCSISGFINCNLNLQSGNADDNKVDLDKMFKKYGTNEGMTFKDALHYLKHEGIQTNKGLFKIDQYAMVGSIPVLKTALVMNGPCIGGLPVKNSTYPEFWKGNGFEGGHAVAIIGYDKDGFIIRNSWGSYYGNKGYGHIKYEDFNNFYEIWTPIKN